MNLHRTVFDGPLAGGPPGSLPGDSLHDRPFGDERQPNPRVPVCRNLRDTA
jgi:hypothetical protein